MFLCFVVIIAIFDILTKNTLKTILIMSSYSKINYEIMTDTKKQYESLPKLKVAVQFSIKHQYMIKHEQQVNRPLSSKSRSHYIVSPKRSLEAASAYPGKKVAVLNFANNHDIGGAPFSAGAQEESICRCSTLYPCLQAMRDEFYNRHRDLYEKRIINHIGNDDLIYTPDVVVFKTDERTDPIYPVMMPEDKWFKVDIITCAAPELWHGNRKPDNYNDIIASRIRKILDVAAIEQVEVLILGAWGCGAFKNPADVIAGTFHNLLAEYDFETVEFALASEGDTIFHKVFAAELDNSAPAPTEPSTKIISFSEHTADTVKNTIISLLRATGRDHIESMISWMEKNAFFEASASVNRHNAFIGGLAKHSLDVYNEAMALNASQGLPETSVTLCALLHDVCKADQYYVDADGNPQCNKYKKNKGHGLRSLFIITRAGKLPLNYDEAMAIWWHMGENEESLKRHRDKYENYFEESKKIDLCKLIRKADGIAAHKALDKSVVPNYKTKWERQPLINYKKILKEVSYNPKNCHWYLDTYPVPLEQYPTEQGFVDSNSLKRRMNVTYYCRVNLDHFTSYDLLFMKDNQNQIGVFTMVSASSESGSFYRTDRIGFGYKSAILYFDTWSSPNMGAHHYLVTQDLEGKWSMVDLYHPLSYNEDEYKEFINREVIANRLDSEQSVLAFLKNQQNGPDLTNSKRFARIDSEGPSDEPLFD